MCGTHYLSTYHSDGVFYFVESNYAAFFKKTSTGYTSPPGISATLTAGSNNSYTLHFYRSNMRLIFKEEYTGVSEIKDKNNNTLSCAYGDGLYKNKTGDGTISSETIKDTTGHVSTYRHDADGRITGLKDVANNLEPLLA